jgi:hypothetical protein
MRAPPPVTVTRWQRSEKRTRHGFVELLFASIGLVIRAVEVHRFVTPSGAVQMWLAYPGRPYMRAGVQRTFVVIYFDRASHYEVADQVFEQLKKMAPDLFAGPQRQEAAA